MRSNKNFNMRYTSLVLRVLTARFSLVSAAVLAVASLVAPLLLAQRQAEGQGSLYRARQLSQLHATAQAAGLTQASMPDAEAAVLDLLAMRETALVRGLALPDMSEAEAKLAARHLNLRSGVLLVRAESLP